MFVQTMAQIRDNWLVKEEVIEGWRSLLVPSRLNKVY
jgi:hypothetical protein